MHCHALLPVTAQYKHLCYYYQPNEIKGKFEKQHTRKVITELVLTFLFARYYKIV